MLTLRELGCALHYLGSAVEPPSRPGYFPPRPERTYGLRQRTLFGETISMDDDDDHGWDEGRGGPYFSAASG